MDVWGVQLRKRFREVAENDEPPPVVEQSDLPGKAPRESMVTLLLPFGSDPALREEYVNFRGQLRFGKLLEDLDSQAGAVAYSHCDDNDDTSEPQTLVTACVDRIDILDSIPVDEDLMLRGMCTFVGRSSLLIDIDLTRLPADVVEATEAGAEEQSSAARGGKVMALAQRAAQAATGGDPLLQASFTFVARDRFNRAVPVPPLVPADASDEALRESGRARVAERQAASTLSLSRLPPTPDELGLLHGIHLRMNGGSKGQPAVATVAQTRKSMTTVTMPQDRNIHGKIFGGWLMRKSFELAWTTAYSFTGQAPEAIAVSDVQFAHPVPIGSVLEMGASVEYALGGDHRTLSVAVEAKVCDPPGPFKTTNKLFFTFKVKDSLPALRPDTYAEAMQWVEAHRRRNHGMQAAAARSAAGPVKARF